MSWKTCLRYADHPISAEEIEVTLLSKDPDYEAVPHYVTAHAYGGGASESFNGEANQVFTCTVSDNGQNAAVVDWCAQTPDTPVSFVILEGSGGTYAFLYDAETSGDAGLAVPGSLESITLGYSLDSSQGAAQAAPAEVAATSLMAVRAARRCLRWITLANGERVCALWR